jgi:hypothetical protein
MELNVDEFRSIKSGLDTITLYADDINRLSDDEVKNATNFAVRHYENHPGGSTEIYAAEKAEFWNRVSKFRNLLINE